MYFYNVFKLNFTESRYFYATKHFKVAFYAVITIFSKRKMDAKFASTTHSQISQSEAFLSLGLFDKTNFTNSSQKWTITMYK